MDPCVLVITRFINLKKHSSKNLLFKPGIWRKLPSHSCSGFYPFTNTRLELNFPCLNYHHTQGGHKSFVGEGEHDAALTLKDIPSFITGTHQHPGFGDLQDGKPVKKRKICINYGFTMN